MAKSNIDTIVFDLGGVLIDWNPRYVYRTIFETEAEIDDFLENVCTHDWNAQQDAGRPLAEATQILIDRHPDWEGEIRAYYGRWIEMLGGPIYETVEILENLKASGRYRLYALTNWSAETFDVPRERYDFLNIFEGIVVSGVEKLIKPDPAIYRILIDRFSLNPRQSVFIDDSLKNVQGARSVGLNGIHFKSPMQLREALADVL